MVSSIDNIEILNPIHLPDIISGVALRRKVGGTNFFPEKWKAKKKKKKVKAAFKRW